MSGAYIWSRECINDSTFVCSTGTLITISEYLALNQPSMLIKVCSGCCSIPICLYLSCISYYMCKECCEDPTETDLHTSLLRVRYHQAQPRRRMTPMSDAMRSSNTTASSAPGSEDMRRESALHMLFG
jgi:hypothetical protein